MTIDDVILSSDDLVMIFDITIDDVSIDDWCFFLLMNY